MKQIAYNGKQISTVVDAKLVWLLLRFAYNGKQISTVVDHNCRTHSLVWPIMANKFLLL